MTDKERAVIEAARWLTKSPWASNAGRAYSVYGLAFRRLLEALAALDAPEPEETREEYEQRVKKYAALDADKCGTCDGIGTITERKNWVSAFVHPCPDCKGGQQ